MKHPVLRRVKSLHIIMMTDLMAMDYESRVKFMSLDEQNIDKQRPFPEVHVSLILNLEDSRESCLRDVLFLLNLLADSIHIDFQIYSSRRAFGRLIFAIRKEFVSIGMLEEGGRCLSVTVSEDEEYCRQIYEVVQTYANQESLLFEKINVPDALRCNNYTEAYISSNTRWLVAHMMEKFMPDPLFGELVERVFGEDASMSDIKEVLYRTHKLENSLLGTVRIRMLVYDSAITSLVSQDEVDFCGSRVKLTADQKIALLEHILEMMETYEQFEMRLIVGRLSEDILFSPDQSMFLSERSAFLRIMNVNGQMQFLVTVRKEMKTLLDQFYEEVWDMPADVILSDQRDIRERIEFAISLIRRMSQSR
ncbi:MAG: hypothetical protein LIO80_06545 [Lachnospiraceae bacterium]|nr:hypothetical protein [Lachnospiraceae bacterium]